MDDAARFRAVLLQLAASLARKGAPKRVTDLLVDLAETISAEWPAERIAKAERATRKAEERARDAEERMRRAEIYAQELEVILKFNGENHDG